VNKESALNVSHLYTFGSLETFDGGNRFAIKNRLFDAELTRISEVSIDGEPVALSEMSLEVDGQTVQASDLSNENSIELPLRTTILVTVRGESLELGAHHIEATFDAEPYGRMSLDAEDYVVISEETDRIPRDTADDYTPEIIEARRQYVYDHSGVRVDQIARGSFEPSLAQGNIENFIGVAQVPVGLAGPIRINGEHANGDFLVPMATTEGTLIASYSRGMKVVNACGGVTVTIDDDCMQRAPVFVFDSAREARDFRGWVDENLDSQRVAAEATTSFGKLLGVDIYLASKFAFLRFNFSTGDAAGQNMVSKATFAACSVILEKVKSVRRFYMESNFATDKKASQINLMRTRGKRVTAEILIPREVLTKVMRVNTESLAYHGSIANVGSFMSGANNNGLHSANAIAAIAIATGQDAANVAESSAAVVHSDLTPDKSLYFSITLPSLIIATHGGGTGLPTQNECLEIMGCTGLGSVNKLAEIIAGTVLAGEISLASAISSLDWVSSHEQYGRNR